MRRSAASTEANRAATTSAGDASAHAAGIDRATRVGLKL
jgi:hypothetical protein